MSYLEKVPGLTRMVTVDNNTLKGRIEELPLYDHNVILAKNGSGKTSLIQLLPIFMGENMNAVINSHERDSFLKHYLPRDSSYLAFEYRNHLNEIRAVVIHSDPSKEKIQYRFIRGGLSADMFRVIHDDGSVSFVTNAGFDTRLRELGVDFAPRLITSTRAYRGIIQGRIDDGTESRDRAYHRQLANDYGMSTSKAPLTGTEKLLTQMLRNSVSISSLLGVVARLASENGVESYKLLGESSKEQIAAWPKTFKAYRKVMDAEPKARDLQDIALRFSQHQADIIERFNALAAFEEDFISGLSDCEARITTLSAEKTSATKSFEEEIQKLSHMISAHRADIDTLATQISRIEKTRDDLIAKGADSARETFGRLAAIEAALDLARTRHKTLTQQGEDLLRSFDAERLALRDKAASSKAAQVSRHMEEIATVNAEIESHDASVAERIQASEDEGRASIEAQHASLEARLEAHAELRLKLGTLEPDTDMAARKANSLANLEALKSAADLARVVKTNAASAFKDADHKWQIATRNLRDADRDLEAALKARAEVEAEYNPKDGSLLAFLRRNMSGWGDTIGKVIHPDLLQRTNLSPDITDDTRDSLFGLLIDLDRIALPDHADDTRLEARMMRASDHVDAAEKTRANLNEELVKAARDRKKAETDLSAATAALGIAEGKLESAQKTHDTILSQVDLHLREKGSGLSLEIERSQTEINEARSRLDNAKGELRKRITALRQTGDAQHKNLLAARSRLQDAHDAAIAEINDGMKRAEAALKADQDAALSEKGLDAKTISELEEQIAKLSGDRERSREARSLAEDWDRSLELVKSLPDLAARKSDAEYRLNRDTAALEAKKSDQKSTIEGFVTRIEQANKARDSMTLALQQVSARLKAAPSFVTASPVRGACHERGFEVTLQEIGVAEGRLTEDRTAMVGKVKALAGIFRHCGDPGISAYLDSKGLTSDYGLSWVKPILDWYEFEHAQYRDMLMQGIGMIIEPMNIAYHALAKADREISSLNRKLSEAIRNNEGFNHVRDVNISIRSGITEQPSWPLMEAVNRAHTAWKNSPSDQPPEDLIEALDAFLSHWDGGKEPVLRLDQMIYLDGSMTEGGNLRRFSRNTNLSELSSNGNIIVLRLILFTALLTVMRRGRKIRLVWAVDEIGALDIENTQSLLKMLKGNGIVLLTAAPTLDRRVKEHFPLHMRIDQQTLFWLDSTARNGIREWLADDQLDYPETQDVMEGEAA